jgi:hypothetical protein
MPDGEREGGTGVTLSSIIVNDNILDVTAKSGEKVGDPVAFGSLGLPLLHHPDCRGG